MAQAKKALVKSSRKQPAKPSSRASVKTYNNYIGGKWVPSESGEVFENINPADSEDVIGRFQLSTSDDVNDAVRTQDVALDDPRDAADHGLAVGARLHLDRGDEG